MWSLLYFFVYMNVLKKMRFLFNVSTLLIMLFTFKTENSELTNMCPCICVFREHIFESFSVIAM